MNNAIHPYRLAGWGLAALVLIVPAIGNQVSDEVNWTGGDFMVMGLMLLCAGLAIELVVRTIATGNKRMMGVLVIIGLFLWLWAELAVGVFTNWGS